ncbi:MATE family efflux transporter [Gallaecimonas sp. GXIMD1310]|uniref:MATE family efflux transporter n=1 Tax=Gallaecimonas sp. GXIMD1310 TaxID=3131926 RepID=UPI0032471735
MRDLTQGSVRSQIIAMSVPIIISMLVQTLYQMVDLYFVAHLGSTALAGVNTAGSVMMLVMALTQTLSVGTVALIARAIGGKDTEQANRVFNQALSMALLTALLTLLAGYPVAQYYIHSLAADTATSTAGLTYLHWSLPALAMMFINAAMGAGLRGSGIVKPTMVVQLLTVLLNMLLTPIMTAGWLTGHPLGVMGAALSTTLSVVVGMVVLAIYMLRHARHLAVHRQHLWPRWATWRQLLVIGLPAGGEFALMFTSTILVYWLIKGFGAEAQAAYGVGSRLMQFFYLPAMAVSFALPAIVGQNLGARQGPRIREALKQTLLIEALLMLIAMLLCQWHPAVIARIFTTDATVVQIAVEFLSIMSFAFLAGGITFSCSSFFQGMGNTWPALFSAAMRLLLFAIGVGYLSHQQHFSLTTLWYWMVLVGFLQALLSWLLARREMARQLPALQSAEA